MCKCVNFAAFINREVGKVKNVYLSIHFAGLLLCTQLRVWLMHLCTEWAFIKSMNPDETLHNQAE